MGNLMQNAADLNPVTAVSNAVKATVHDISVYVLNDCSSDCNLCGCWVFGFRSRETHDDTDNDTSLNIAWHQ